MTKIVSLKAIFNQDEFKKSLDLVSKWDFSLTKQKLLEPDYAGWTETRIEKAEQDYKRYLALTKALNGYQLIPNGDIDRFWHEHILDTRRYVQDCTELFGGFLHHYPYFGMRGEADNKAWIDISNESANFWNDLFNEDLYDIGISDAQKCPQKCPGIIDAVQKTPQKCPQKCPGVYESIDKDYPYLQTVVLKEAA